MQHQHCYASAACFHLRLKLCSLILHDLHADSALLNLLCRLPNSPEPQGNMQKAHLQIPHRAMCARMHCIFTIASVFILCF